VPTISSGTVALTIGASSEIGEHVAIRIAREEHFHELCWIRCTAPLMCRCGISEAYSGRIVETGTLSAREQLVAAMTARGEFHRAIGLDFDVCARAVEQQLPTIIASGVFSDVGNGPSHSSILVCHVGGSHPVGLARGSGERSCDESSC
jgi:hypothetical protein